MKANFEQFVALRRFDALDGLRAVSVIAVVWHHTSGKPGPLISQKGYLGVELFFAISGFLITTLLVRERGRTGGISLRKFYARRALRIFPLYYATLLAYIVLVAATQRETPEGRQFFRNLPAFATYTSNWFVEVNDTGTTIFYYAWSLATEEQFYLLWPPLLLATLAISCRKPRVWPALAVLATLIAISQGARMIADLSTVPWRIPASLSLPILLGAAVAIVLNDRRGFDAICTILGRRWSAPVAFTLMVILMANNGSKEAIQVVMVCVVVSVCVVERTMLHPLLQWRPLAFVGVISYGIYLLHMLCANLVRRVIHDRYGTAVFAATLITVIVVAYLSFRYFESPLLRLKRRFETGPERAGDEISRIAAVSMPARRSASNEESQKLTSTPAEAETTSTAVTLGTPRDLDDTLTDGIPHPPAETTCSNRHQADP